MYTKKSCDTDINAISDFLGIERQGQNFKINSFSSLNNPCDNSIMFFSPKTNKKFNLDDNVKYDLDRLASYNEVALIVPRDFTTQYSQDIHLLETDDPRLDFQRVIMNFFAEEEFRSGIHDSAVIEKNAEIGAGVYIGPNCYIGNNVRLGENVKILANSSVFGTTQIGKNSVVMSNTTIASEGFSFSYTGNELFHFAHLGDVLIGENVWIGANCTIEKSQIGSTIIEDHVKIDDLVHIGHNTKIRRFSQITVGSIIAGRAIIGEGCWVSPNSVVDTGCTVGDDSLVGTSSLVRTNIASNSVVVGSPAKPIKR